MKKTVGFVVVLAILAGAGYYYKDRFLPSTSETQASLLSVDVIQAEKKEFFPTLSYVAKIEAKDRVEVRARVTGFLTKRLFNEGEFVKEGQLLFLIEKDQFEATVRKAEANLASAIANEENQAAQYKRAKDLFKTKDVSEARLDEQEALYSSAKAAVKQTQSELDIAQLDLDYTDIKAPISGRIGEAIYSVGSLIGPESGSFAAIVSTSPMYAVFSVSENQLLQIRDFLAAGHEEMTTGENNEMKISFILANGTKYDEAGSLNFIDIALDDQMNTLKLRASFPNPDNKLIAGQYGRVELQFEHPQEAVLLPQVALQRDLAGPFVYRVNDKDQLEIVRVKTGLELTSGDIIIEEGIEPGDRIVMNNFQRVMMMPSGTPVHPVLKETEEQDTPALTEE